MRISDWSSDVCSSDLLDRLAKLRRQIADGLNDREHAGIGQALDAFCAELAFECGAKVGDLDAGEPPRITFPLHRENSLARSEQRRVGKGWCSTGRSRWPPDP